MATFRLQFSCGRSFLSRDDVTFFFPFLPLSFHRKLRAPERLPWRVNHGKRGSLEDYLVALGGSRSRANRKCLFVDVDSWQKPALHHGLTLCCRSAFKSRHAGGDTNTWIMSNTLQSLWGSLFSSFSLRAPLTSLDLIYFVNTSQQRKDARRE